MPVSRLSAPFAPQIHIRISEEALPPSTGRSCIRTTFSPSLAAEMAAAIPAIPPPITHRSHCSVLFSSMTFPPICDKTDLCYNFIIFSEDLLGNKCMKIERKCKGGRDGTADEGDYRLSGLSE